MPLTAKDPVTGEMLKGFSQIDLDKLNEKISENNILLKQNTEQEKRNAEEIAKNRRVLLLFLAVIALFIFYLFYMTWYIIHNNVVNNVVSHCL